MTRTTVFDRLRTKYKPISAACKLANTAFYPFLFALVCIISGVSSKDVYIPCIYFLTILAAIIGLFSDDLKVFLVPFFLVYYAIGMDVPPNFYSSYILPDFDKSSMLHFAVCAFILAVVLLYRLISRGYFLEVLQKRGIFFWGIILFDIGLILSGLLSPQFSLYSTVFIAFIAAVLTACYMLFTVIISHSKDGIAYACKVLIALGFLVVSQVLIIATRLAQNDYLFVEDMLNRGKLSLTWGLATIVGGILVPPIVAAVYMMRNRKFPLLSLLSALIFWIATVLIDTRSAIIFGAAIIAVGIILSMIKCKNRVLNRFTFLSLLLLGGAAWLIFVNKFPDTYHLIADEIIKFLRLDFDFDNFNAFSSSRMTIWVDGWRDFISAPIFGVGFRYGYFTPETASLNLFSNMYHNIFIQLLASTGIVGALLFLIHIKHLAEVMLRGFTLDKLILLLVPASIIGMSFVDNFFFYPNFIIIYTAFLACAEISLEQARRAKLENLKPRREGKPRVVFTYVEAGKGHIVPTHNVCEAFKRKYGDRAEVIESKFFTETGSRDMEKTEILFRRAVQNQNRSPILSWLCKLGNLIAGDTFALFVLLRMTVSGRKTNPLAVKHIEELDADLVYSAHWSIPFYINQLKTPRPYSVCFCPDVYSNGAFNVDCNDFLISSDVGYNQVQNRMRMYAGGNITYIPFPMRPEVDNYRGAKIRAELREKLFISKDEFVVALCDGGYGMAKLEKTAKRLMNSKQPMTIIALCGMNHELYRKLKAKESQTPSHIRLIAVDFTDKVLEYIAVADVFAGKSGANAIAEPAALGIPIIVTKCITYIERGIKNYYVRKIKGAIYRPSSRLAARKIERFAQNRELLKKYQDNLKNSHRQHFDAEASADLIWERLNRD